jgi:hypothetical protein
MALMNVEIYEALISAGVAQDKAKSAAISAVADYQMLADKIDNLQKDVIKEIEGQDKKIITIATIITTIIPIIMALLAFLLNGMK